MPLARTKTLGNQDVVLSAQIASITAAGTLYLVSPIAGEIERVLICRSGAHSTTPEAYTITTQHGALPVQTGLIDGAALDVDAFEFVPGTPIAAVAAGESFSIANAGSPDEAEPVGVTVVIRRT